VLKIMVETKLHACVSWVDLCVGTPALDLEEACAYM
jgi:hypothetical protein